MGMRQLIGGIMFALPIGVLIVYVAVQIEKVLGWKIVLGTFVAMLAVFAWTIVAIELMYP
jgi:hypothetical protein